VVPSEEREVTVRAWIDPPAPYGRVWLHGHNLTRDEQGAFAELRPEKMLADAPLLTGVRCDPRIHPMGPWRVTVEAISDGRLIGSDTTNFTVSKAENAVIILEEQVRRLRKELALAMGDPDVKLDDSNSVVVSASQVKRALLKAWPRMDPSRIFLSDGEYRAPTRLFATYLAQMTGIHLRKYVPTKHDCDDYSFAMQGVFSHPRLSEMSSGLIWGKRTDGSGNHALDALALAETDSDGDLDVTFLETQLGALRPPNNMDKPSLPWTPYLLPI